jgi:hypothetical protein
MGISSADNSRLRRSALSIPFEGEGRQSFEIRKGFPPTSRPPHAHITPSPPPTRGKRSLFLRSCITFNAKWHNPILFISLISLIFPLACTKLKFDNPYDPKNRPSGPQAFSPSEGVTITDNPPQFSWAPCGVDTAYYHLQISPDSLFSSTVFEDDHLHGTTLGLSFALPYGQLNWRVRAAKAKDAWGPWSPVHSFFCKYGPVFHSPEMGFDVCIEGNRLFTAYNGFRIWDLSNPSQPHLLDSYFQQGKCQIAVSQSYAYLNYPYPVEKFQVVEVSNSSSPTLVGSTDFSPEACALVVQGNLAYVWERIRFGPR